MIIAWSWGSLLSSNPVANQITDLDSVEFRHQCCTAASCVMNGDHTESHGIHITDILISEATP